MTDWMQVMPIEMGASSCTQAIARNGAKRLPQAVCNLLRKATAFAGERATLPGKFRLRHFAERLVVDSDLCRMALVSA